MSRLFSNQEVCESIRKRSHYQIIESQVRGIYLKCKECNGTGLDYQEIDEGRDKSWSGNFCEKCEGTGYVDWITNIVEGK